MPGLPLQLVPIPIGGLNSKADPKGAPFGVLSTAENVYFARRTLGGFESRKRNGFSTLTRSVIDGTTLSAGVMGAAYGNELVVCDGLKLYAYSTILQKWIPKGRFQTIAADLFSLSGDETSETNSNSLTQVVRPNLDVAYQSGYSCHVSSLDGSVDETNNASVRVYVRDTTTGSVVATFVIPQEYKARVVGVGGFFFVFSSSTLGSPSGLHARKIDTAAPQTISSPATVAADLNDNLVFDATVEAGATRMWVSYYNQAGAMTIKSWTTANAVGVSSTYAGVAPYYSIGFLNWDFSNGKGYVGVGALAANAEARVIEFSTTSGAETANTLCATTGSVSFDQITGYRTAAGVLNVFWYENQFLLGWQYSGLQAYSGGSTYLAMKSVAPIGRVFKVGAKWYIPVAVGTGLQGSRSLVLEIDENSTGQNGSISIAGMLQNQDAAGRLVGTSCLATSALLPDGTLLTPLPASLNRPTLAGAIEGTHHYAVRCAQLSFAGTGLGRPVEFNGVLHLPAASHRTYDGKSVVEAGFHADPLGLATLAVAVASGGMTPGTASPATSTVYQYCVTMCRLDNAGRAHRSAPSPISKVSLDSTHTSTSGQVFAFPFTDNAPETNDDQNVATLRIEIWRTVANLDIFYLNQTLVSDPGGGGGPVAFTDGMSDAQLQTGEILYTTSGELDNQKAPAVKVLLAHADRLFALTGDRSTWYSKLSAEGFGTEMSDEFRILVGDQGGAPVGLAAVDAVFAICKRNRVYVVVGQGPDDKGNNVYGPPQPMSADLGLVSATGVASTPDGAVLRTAKGFALLTRGFELNVLEGSEAFDGLPVTGGTALDGLPLVAFTTSNQLVVRDWQLGQWYDWTNAGSFLAGVACFRWNQQLAILQADGTVKVQVAAQFFDGTSTPIDQTVQWAWFNLSNARVYKALVRGTVLANCTLAATWAYDLDDSDNASKSLSVTATSKQPFVFQPNRGDCASIHLLLHESSITEGLRLTSVELEVGMRPGAQKHRAGQYAT